MNVGKYGLRKRRTWHISRQVPTRYMSMDTVVTQKTRKADKVTMQQVFLLCQSPSYHCTHLTEPQSVQWPWPNSTLSYPQSVNWGGGLISLTQHMIRHRVRNSSSSSCHTSFATIQPKQFSRQHFIYKQMNHRALTISSHITPVWPRFIAVVKN